jgi:signal transduction histidine kinase/DNA-binding response OmpR family regulator
VEVSNNSETLLSKVIDETDRITLNHDQSVFTFEFIGLNYSYPEKNKYAFKLEGLDHDWNYVGNQRSATYRYLPAGTYEFKVKATSQDNVWPAQYASIQLVILPPFWKTPFAYFLYFLTVAFTAYGAISFRKKQDVLRKRLRIEKTQRKRERLMVQEKLSFFTEVSHEFRTPLTLMIGPLEEILMREGAYTPVGRKLKMVYKNAHKLLNLINKLLDYRKVETGNMVLKVKEDNIVSFVEEIFITFREMAIRKNIRFEFYSEQPSIVTWFDKEKLEMVLNNIISNSFKYIGRGDAISITVRHKNAEGTPDKAVIQIRDNGIGIPKNQLKYIFDWFYQGNKSSPVSSGIGLALAKKLVYLHKGQLYVESEEGKGAEFTIEIPMGRDHFKANEIVIDEENASILFNADPSLLADTDTEHSHKKGLKSFLIVEDDPDVRQFLKEFFERDYKIYESDCGSEGLEIAIEHNPDVVISDVMMPQMNGIDLCKQLKSNIKTSHIPVILLTAKTSFSHHKEGLEIGADAYITKPFSPEMLSLTINNLLQSRENLKRFYRNLFITNGSDKNELASPDGKLLHRVYEFLKSNLDKPEFSLDDLCEELAMSRSLLYKKIKMLTGLSPVEYIRSLRLAEAANLLKTGKYKVFEVVYMVGFTDIKYFRQCFVKEFGYPPSQLIE